MYRALDPIRATESRVIVGRGLPRAGFIGDAEGRHHEHATALDGECSLNP